MAQETTNGDRARPRPFPWSALPVVVLAVLAAAVAGCGDDGSSPDRADSHRPAGCRHAIGRGRGAAVGRRMAVAARRRRLLGGVRRYRDHIPGGGDARRVSDRHGRAAGHSGCCRVAYLDSTQRLSIVPDAPPGDYFIFEIDGVYELRPNARERVTAVSESDGWPVVGIYLIR